VEVADSSVQYDRMIKMPLYARSGIPEVWFVDVARDLVEVYARPVNGRYQDFREAKRGETLTLSSLPNLAISVDDILGGVREHRFNGCHTAKEPICPE
jgi:Uma2 family endonuclease